MCAHAKFYCFGGTEGIGCVPMQILLLLAEPEALGVCPCRIYCFWQSGRHWACAHAKFYCFWQNWRYWACANAEFYCFGRARDVGCVPMQNFIALAQLEA